VGYDLQHRLIPQHRHAPPRIARIYRQYNHIRILPYSRMRRRSPKNGTALPTNNNKI